MYLNNMSVSREKFRADALRKLPDPSALVEIAERTAGGENPKGVVDDEFETPVGEVPPVGLIPGQVVFSKAELSLPSSRLQETIRWARTHKRRIVISSVIAGVVGVIATIGLASAVRHLKKQGHKDITDLKLPSQP